MGDQYSMYDFIYAVKKGRLERVREICSSVGPSYLRAWILSEGYNLLRRAVKNDHTDVVKLLLAYGSKVNSNHKKLNTPLHYATINGDIEIVEMLLNKGAEIDAKNRFDKTPLHSAVESKKVEIVELLLSRDANVDAKRNDDKTALHIAAERGYLQIVEHLLNYEANININNINYFEKDTPLHLAVAEHREEIVKLLLRRGANVDAKGNGGRTALHIAAKGGNLQIVEHLLNHGANMNSEYYTCNGYARYSSTPLHFAVEGRHEEIMNLLLSRGVNINIKAADGATALHIAVEKGYIDIVEHLLNHGANVNCAYTSTWREGYTPLHLAVSKHGEEMIKLLLSRGANVDAKCYIGATPLHIATGCRNLEIVEHLLNHGANIDSAYTSSLKEGYTALHIAVEENAIEMVQLLLNRGANVNAVADIVGSPIGIAAIQGYLDIVEELLKYGADVNMYSSRMNNKPLHLAIEYRREKIAKLLISYGADINAPDNYKKNPIFYATKNADSKMFKLLLIKGANVKDNPELLIIAVQKACREIIEDLLQQGADVNTSDKYGRTVLHYTALDKCRTFHIYNDYYEGEIAKLLLNKGVNVNAQTEDGITTLHAASKIGYVRVVEALLTHNADVNSTDFKFNMTALHISAQEGYPEIVEVLLQYGADINCKDKNGRTALHIASKHRPEWLDGGRDSERDTIFKILKHHVIKMKTVNLYVSKENLQFITSDHEISYFQNECDKEIESMKSEKFNNANGSFYDILTKDINQLARYVGNESIVQVLRSDDYKIKFPLYADIINSHFKKGEERKDLLEQSNKIFHFFFNNFGLLQECTEKIFSYLSNENLRILIDTYIYVSNCNT